MQKGTLAITEEPIDHNKVKTPPTILVGLKESQETPTAPVEVSRPRPSLVDGLRRKTMKFRQWMGRLVSAKSYGPGVLEFEGVSDEEDAACSSNEKPKEESRNHFLAAYLTGDLEVLDFCLQASAGKHGQRSFIAIAQEHGEISLDEWLRMFHAASMKKKLKELSGTSYEEDVLKRAFVLRQKLTAEPRRQIDDSKEVKPVKPKAKGHVQPENVVIFTDFEEAAHQVAWAKTLGERLVRGTEAADLTRESVRHALPDTVAKALDGLSPALRLARAAARAAQRGLWLDASAELRCLWGLSALEPQAVQLALLGAKQSAGRHLGFVIRCASRKILADEGTSPSSADQEEMLLLALLLAQELGRQRHGIQGTPAPGIEEAPDPVLMKALQPKSFLLTLAVIVHLLDREVVPRDDQICAAAFWQDLASQMLRAVWAMVDQAYGDAPLRLQLAQLARATGLSPPSRECDQAKSPLSLRAAAVASGSHKAQLAQRLRRPARVPVEGLGPLLASRKDSEVKTSSSWRSRSRDKLRSDDSQRAEDALEQVCTSLEEMEEVSQDLLKSLVFYGAPFFADRLVRDFPSCQDNAKRLISQLKGALLEVGSTEAEPASPMRPKRKQQIGGNSAREAEIREVRRSWDAEMEIQWFDLLRLSADSEDDSGDESDAMP